MSRVFEMKSKPNRQLLIQCISDAAEACSTAAAAAAAAAAGAVEPSSAKGELLGSLSALALLLAEHQVLLREWHPSYVPTVY
jgi:hypothetical protein